MPDRDVRTLWDLIWYQRQHPYTVTSNHVHLSRLARDFVNSTCRDEGDRDEIPKSIQLIAGRTGQEFNQRKNRKGAYWEARYHATAVETDEHLVQCLVYIDLNMVRAGVVKHPSEWAFGGYNEIQAPRQRYALIDYEGLKRLLGFGCHINMMAWFDPPKTRKMNQYRVSH